MWSTAQAKASSTSVSDRVRRALVFLVSLAVLGLARLASADQVLPAPTQTTNGTPAPTAWLLWAAPPGESAPAPLLAALSPHVVALPAGSLAAAGQALLRAKKDVVELRCVDVLAGLIPVTEQLLADHALQVAQPLLVELFGLRLLCADRLGDANHARLAARALQHLRVTPPADLALVLARYASEERFGPPLPPVQIESDPPGATVFRNLQPVGVTPLSIEGGRESEDRLDVELPGYRKLHRSLGAGGHLVLSLRPEDRAGILAEQATLLPIGSVEQAQVLSALVVLPALIQQPMHTIVVLSPKERSGQALLGEALLVRVFDGTRRSFTLPLSDIAAGTIESQAASVRRLLASPETPGVTALAQPAAPTTAPAKAAPKKRGLFGGTKWYTWVVAGGVVALIAGLLIAEKTSPEKVTLSATR